RRHMLVSELGSYDLLQPCGLHSALRHVEFMGKQPFDAGNQQCALAAVFGLKAGLVGMDGDHPLAARTVLVVAGAERQDEPMCFRLGAAVDVVDRSPGVVESLFAASDAAHVLTEHVVETLLFSGDGAAFNHCLAHRVTSTGSDHWMTCSASQA